MSDIVPPVTTAPVSVRSPLTTRYCISRTLAPNAGWPNSSRIVPAMTLPRGIFIVTPVIFWLSASVIGVPGRSGRFAPYDVRTKPGFDAESE